MTAGKTPKAGHAPGSDSPRGLRVSHKLLGISLAFIAPVALLLYSFNLTANKDVRFARKEQCGLTYNQALRQLIEQTRPLSLAPRSAALPQLDAWFADFDALEAERCMDGSYREDLQTAGLSARLRGSWQALKALPDGPARAEFQRNLLALFAHAGDTSNLILDPDLDTYYVMDLVLIRVPEVVSFLTRLEPGAGPFSAGEAEHMRRLLATVERNMAVGFANNNYYPGSSGTLQGDIGDELEAWFSASRQLLTTAPEVQVIAVAGDAFFELYDAASAWEYRALQARMDELNARKWRALALIGALMLLAGWLAFATSRGIVQRLAELARVSERMARGERGLAVTVRGGDEVSVLGGAFNRMAADLKLSYEGIEAQVQARTQELRETSRQVALLQAVAASANEAASPAEAIQTALDRVCAHTGWPVGHAYLLAEDGTGELAPTRIWHLDAPAERFETFRRVTEATRFKPGIGLPGRVLAGGRATWITDVMTDPNFPRAKMAGDIGLHAAFGFPILIGRQVAGVLEFLSTETAEPNAALLELMVNAGTQLGRAMERDRAGRQLAASEEQARSASRAKGEFLANVSHELRTPMNAIVGFSDLALRTPSDQRRLEHVQHIETASRSLLGIINQILDLSKIESGKFTLETREFELQPVLDRVADLLAAQAAAKNVEIVVAPAAGVPGVLLGDSLRLEQVLNNLMSNALKFTERGEVVLRVALLSRQAASVELEFTVRDTGIGLTPEQLSRLFQPFSQADQSTTRKYGGTGLGLAICKQMIGLMGGDISVQSEAGQGSCFRFTLSLGVIDREPAHGAAGALAGRRVLVVDDNEAARRMYSELLGSLRFVPEAVASAAEGLAQLELTTYDAVLMDWKMPKMDGIEAIRLIRAQAALAKLPVVLMTAHGREDLARQAREAGANAYLEKPVKPSLLLETLQDLLDAPAGNRVTVRRETVAAMDPAQKLRGKRVLLVEDNALNRRLAGEILREAGVRLDVAEDGRKALSAVRQESYDAVLMDMQMPEMDGLEATRAIRKLAGCEYLPIIAMTANAFDEDRAACLAAGMNDFLAKPIDAEQMLVVLERWACRAQPEAKP